MNKRTEILNEASTLINGDRQADYGPPHENFGRIADMWTAYLGHRVLSSDVAVMMALLKASRIANNNKPDSFVDGAAYFALAGELVDYD